MNPDTIAKVVEDCTEVSLLQHQETAVDAWARGVVLRAVMLPVHRSTFNYDLMVRLFMIKSSPDA